MKNRLTALLGALAVFAVMLLGGGREARADLAYHGGPVLKSFEIIPYYYGPWDAAARDQHQQYLVGLAQYMSGANAPYGQQPTLVQYGVTAVGVRPPVIETNVATPVSLDTPAGLAVIHAAQAAGKLPPYSPNRLILLLVPPSIDLTVHCGYHGAEAIGKYYAFVSARGCKSPRTRSSRRRRIPR
jgi:hypothetical protein